MSNVSFHDLPIELRAEIYKLAMHCIGSMVLMHTPCVDEDGTERTADQLRFKLDDPSKLQIAERMPLTRVSKMVRGESLRVLFSINSWEIIAASVAMAFLDHIDEAGLHIRRMHVKAGWGVEAGTRLIKTVLRMPQLQQLNLPVHPVFMNQGQKYVRKFCRTLGPWFEAKGGVRAGLAALFELHVVPVYTCVKCSPRYEHGSEDVCDGTRKGRRCGERFDPKFEHFRRLVYAYFRKELAESDDQHGT